MKENNGTIVSATGSTQRTRIRVAVAVVPLTFRNSIRNEQALMRNGLIGFIILMMSLATPTTATWTTPVPVTEVNILPGENWAPFLSADRLTLYYSRLRTPDFTHGRIYRATRAQPTGDFSAVTEISELNRPANHVLAPWVSDDNLRMYYHTEESTGWNLRLSQRDSVNAPWPQGTVISEISNVHRYAQVPRLTSDELTIFFNVNTNPTGGGGNQDIWTATRLNTDSVFDNMRSVSEINTAAHEVSAFPSADGLELYFSSSRNGGMKLFKATRESTAQVFGEPLHLDLFDMPGNHSNFPALSSDGMALYFMGQTGGSNTRDIYVSYIPEPTTIAFLTIGALILKRRRMPRNT